MKKTIPFKIAPPKIKYLGINLIKEVKDLYAKNNKTLIKETEAELHTNTDKREEVPHQTIPLAA